MLSPYLSSITVVDSLLLLLNRPRGSVLFFLVTTAVLLPYASWPTVVVLRFTVVVPFESVERVTLLYWPGGRSVADLVSEQADRLSDTAATAQRVKGLNIRISFLIVDKSSNNVTLSTQA